MSKLKVSGVNVHDNMIKIGNKCIWLDPGMENIMDVRNIPHKRNMRMHVFMSGVKSFMKDGLLEFLSEFFYTAGDNPSVTIHLPPEMHDLKVVARNFVDRIELANGCPRPKVIISCEKQPVKFRIPGKIDNVSFSYEDDSIEVTVKIVSKHLSEYIPKHMAGSGLCPGVVKNNVQAIFPELFKDKMIARFKEICPEGILKSFGGDDIWNYITNDGEWKEREW